MPLLRQLPYGKNNYLCNILNNSPSLSKRWRQLRSMGVSKKQPSSATSYFSQPTLNSHFSAVNNRHSSLTASKLNDILNSPRPRTANLNQFSFSSLTDKQVLSVIKSSYSSSCDPDQIFTAMLKLCVPTILSHLTALINASFSSSQFPTSWKHSHIRALFKTCKAMGLPNFLKWPKFTSILTTINFSPILSPTSYSFPTKHATARKTALRLRSWAYTRQHS